MPIVKFVSKTQSRRFQALQRRQAYMESVINEVVKPLLEKHRRANLEMDSALAEIGIPLDGRDVRLDVRNDAIFFEDEGFMWSEKEECPIPRPEESKAAWAKKFPPGSGCSPVPVKTAEAAEDGAPPQA